MGLKEGSFISLSGRYDEDVWEDETTHEKHSMPVIILDELEFSGGGKRSGDGQNATSNKGTPAPVSPSSNAVPDATGFQSGYQMPGNFTGYEGFGGGNNFFNL